MFKCSHTHYSVNLLPIKKKKKQKQYTVGSVLNAFIVLIIDVSPFEWQIDNSKGIQNPPGACRSSSAVSISNKEIHKMIIQSPNPTGSHPQHLEIDSPGVT